MLWTLQTKSQLLSSRMVSKIGSRWYRLSYLLFVSSRLKKNGRVLSLPMIHWATIRREVRGSSIIRCKEKQCHQNAKSDDWNGCRPGQRGAFCALSDEKISWPLSSNEFNQISRCKQCPKIGLKRRRVHNSIEWGKPKNCLQVRVFDITNACAVILAYFCQTQIRKRSW